MSLHRSQGPEEGKIENISGNTLFSLIEHGVDVEVVSRDIVACPFLDNLRSLMVDITPEQVGEVEKTIHYLYTKFQPIYETLQSELSISPEYFLEGLVTRLVQQIQTANSKPEKKFFNADVSSLKRMSASKDGSITMELENIPYWSFTCTGVSLDAIHFDTTKGNKSLRNILDTVSKDNKNHEGEYVLPNSLGVSVMIQLADGTIIGQLPNNLALATNYSGLKASASGAMIPLSVGPHNIFALQIGAAAELDEELGITSEHLPHLPDITDMAVSMQQHILRELGISNTSFSALAPLGIVVEGKRENPEVVFTLVLPPSITFEDVYKNWLNAQDKNESRQLVAVTPEELEKQLAYYAQHMPQELRDSPTGLEEFIKTHPHCADWVGSHFLMSYLAWKKSVENKKKIFREGTLRLLESSEIPEHVMDTCEFPGSPEKPTEDALVHHGGWFGVFDGATGLAPNPSTNETGGRIAARTAAEVVKNTSGNALTVLEAANDAITRQMDEVGVDTSDPLHRFMTSASLVRKTPHGIEYANVADSTIVVEFADGTIQVITEQVDHDEIALKLWLELVTELGENATYEKVRKHPRMIYALEEGRKKANVGPYGVLRGDYVPASGIQKGFIPYGKNGGIKRVVLFTDGFEIPTETPWNKDDAYYRHVLDILDQGGPKLLAKEVQKVANSDPECLKYPRFKKLDDGACILLDFNTQSAIQQFSNRRKPLARPQKKAA